MIRVVHSGVDTLEASFRGALSEELVSILEEAKKKAQEENLGQPLRVGAMEFLVGSRGLTPWRYVLTNEELHLRLSPAPDVPTVSARLLSLGLLAYGHEALYALTTDLAAAFGARPSGLSRLDLAVDFQGFVPTVETMASVVCPATFRPIYPNLEHPETFQFGRGDIVVRIYNKTRELKGSRKGWLQSAWKRSEAYVEGEDVWRFEVQLRRPILRELWCETAEEAFAHLPMILAYGLVWCSLRVPVGENRSRWPLHPVWEELQAATFAHEPLPRVRAESYIAAFKWTVPQAVGLLSSGAARLGVHDFDLAVRLWKQEMREYIDSSDRDFPTRVDEKRRRLT